MKKYIVILVVGFLLAFAGNSEARGYGYRGGYCTPRGYYCAPRPYVACNPYYYGRIWVPGYWGWNRWHQRIWFGGYWR